MAWEEWKPTRASPALRAQGSRRRAHDRAGRRGRALPGGGRARVKERPAVRSVDLPVYGSPIRLARRKHRMCCPDVRCPRRSWVLTNHRNAAKQCLLSTRAATWVTVQVGGGRTVSEVAAELACDCAPTGPDRAARAQRTAPRPAIGSGEPCCGGRRPWTPPPPNPVVRARAG